MCLHAKSANVPLPVRLCRRRDTEYAAPSIRLSLGLPRPNCTPHLPRFSDGSLLVALELLHREVPFDTTVSLKCSTPDVLSIDRSAIQISIIDHNMQN